MEPETAPAPLSVETAPPLSAAAAAPSLLSATAVPWSPGPPLSPTWATTPQKEVRLHVANIPRDATKADLRQAFEDVWRVDRVEMPLDPATGELCGFAFVSLDQASAADADAVCRRMDGSVLGNRTIKVKLTKRAVAIARENELALSAAEILALFDTEGTGWVPANFSNSIQRLGVLSSPWMASSDPRLRRLVERATSSIIDESNQWKSRQLANVCWGIATLGTVKAPALFEAIAAEAPKQITLFIARDLAKTAWAFSTAGVEAPALFEAIAAEASMKIATFSSRNLSSTVWAYATAGIEAPALFEAVAAIASKKIMAFNAQELANTVWAYATAGFEAPALSKAVAAVARKKMKSFQPQALADTVWSYATAGVEAAALFEAVAAEASKKIAKFNAHELASTVWAFSAAGVASPALFDVVALRIEAKISEFGPNDLSQLHQVYVHLRLDSHQHPLTVLLSLHDAALLAAYLRQEPSPSISQREVSAALFRIGWAHEFQHVTAEGIRLEMAQLASKVAVEFDGPTHYLSSDGVPTGVLDGTSKFKERLLRRLGWKLIRVPYFEWVPWDALEQSKQQEEYLIGKLAVHS